MKSQRQLQVGENIKRNMAEIFLRDEILTLPGSYVTILEADVSPDIKNVRIYIDIFGNDNLHAEIVKQLNEIAPRFRYLLAKKMISRVVPEITFVLDETAKNVIKMENLITVEAKKYKKIAANEKKAKPVKVKVRKAAPKKKK